MDINTTFGEWLFLATFTGRKMERHTRPDMVGGVAVPENLNGLTMGQLIDLSELRDEAESLYRIPEIVLGLGRDETARARAVDVVRLVGWVTGEVEKINRLFEKLPRERLSDNERKAGAEKLRFGLFGMLDWYARRMGIKDHDEVLGVPWMRLYKCMEMDGLQREYERRLGEITRQELERNNRRRRR